MRAISSLIILSSFIVTALLSPGSLAKTAKQRGRDTPPPPKGSAAEKEKKHPSQMARAELVESRQLGRQLLALGRRTRNPLNILAAAQIFQSAPTRAMDPDNVIKRSPGESNAPLVPSRQPAASAKDLVQSDVPEPAELYAEASKMVQENDAADQKPLLAVAAHLARSMVSTRGAQEGPLQHCDQLSRSVRLTYRVAYYGDERALLTINSMSRRQLEVTVLDPEGQVVVEPTEDPLVAWYPKEAGTYRIQLINRWAETVRYCMETN